MPPHTSSTDDSDTNDECTPFSPDRTILSRIHEEGGHTFNRRRTYELAI